MPKLQHFVPQFYLRHFATPETRDTKNPQVWIFPRSKSGGDPRLVSIRKVAAESHLYTPKNDFGARDWRMEEKLGRLESNFGPAWPDLADGFVDLEDECLRKGVALFVATMLFRHPSAARATAEVHAQLVSLLDSAPKGPDGKPFVDSFEHRGKVYPLDPSGFAEYRDRGRDNLGRMFVRSLDANAGRFAKALLGRRWWVAHSEEPVFVTSDAPVVMTHETREKFGYGTPGVVITLPLSPTRVLVIDDHLDEPTGYFGLLEHGPAWLNERAWATCERFMISPRHTDEVCKEMLARNDAEEARAREEAGRR